MYGYVAITLRSRRFGYNHQIWLKSYSTIRRIRVRLRPGLGYDQVIGYDDVRLMLGDVGWQWRFVLSGLKVASQDLVTILDSRVTGLVGVYVLCLCYGTVFAIVLSLPSCCLVTSTVFFGIIMLSSLSPVSWCLCYGIVVAACCLSYCVFAIVFYRAVFLIVLFLVSHCLCYVLCGLWYRACCPRYRAVFVIGLNDIFSSVRCCLRSRCFFVIVLSLSSPCLRHRPVLGRVVRAWSFCSVCLKSKHNLPMM